MAHRKVSTCAQEDDHLYLSSGRLASRFLQQLFGTFKSASMLLDERVATMLCTWQALEVLVLRSTRTRKPAAERLKAELLRLHTVQC